MACATKRDDNLIFKVLELAESLDSYTKLGTDAIAGYSESEFIEHTRLCIEAGFLNGHAKKRTDGSYSVSMTRLTWLGHDELNMRRNST